MTNELGCALLYFFLSLNTLLFCQKLGNIGEGDALFFFFFFGDHTNPHLRSSLCRVDKKKRKRGKIFYED